METVKATSRCFKIFFCDNKEYSAVERIVGASCDSEEYLFVTWVSVVLCCRAGPAEHCFVLKEESVDHVNLSSLTVDLDSSHGAQPTYKYYDEAFNKHGW